MVHVTEEEFSEMLKEDDEVVEVLEDVTADVEAAGGAEAYANTYKQTHPDVS